MWRASSPQRRAHRSGETVQRRLLLEDGLQLVWVHRCDGGNRELIAQPLCQPGGALERPLHGDLLVKHHRQKQRERVLQQQLIGLGIARDRQRSPVFTRAVSHDVESYRCQ